VISQTASEANQNLHSVWLVGGLIPRG